MGRKFNQSINQSYPAKGKICKHKLDQKEKLYAKPCRPTIIVLIFCIDLIKQDF